MLLATALVLGCKRQERSVAPLSAENLSWFGCKSTDEKEGGSNGVGSLKEALSPELLHIKSLKNGRLAIAHVNAFASCGLEEVTVSVTSENNTITIQENTYGGESVNCLCYYDFHYELCSLEYRAYHFILKRDSSLIAEFDLTISQDTDESIY